MSCISSFRFELLTFEIFDDFKGEDRLQFFPLRILVKQKKKKKTSENLHSAFTQPNLRKRSQPELNTTCSMKRFKH